MLFSELSLCLYQSLRYLAIDISLDPDEFDIMRCVAKSSKLVTINYCTIRVYHSNKEFLEVGCEMIPASLHTLALSAKAAVGRWLACIYHENTGPIQFPCPSTVTC
jgi:hypothetical protein